MAGFFSSGRLRKRRRGSGRAAGTMAGLLGAAMGLAVPAAALVSQAKRKAPPKPKPRRKPAATPAARIAGSKPLRRAADAAPMRGSSFRSAVFRCEHGERRYKVFIPGCAAASVTPLPVLVMLHGCGQTPDDFARGTGMNAIAEERGLLVVYPQQPREAHPGRCWNWFRPADQGREAGEPALLAALTRHVLSRHHADPARVYVAGLSAGASAALVLAETHPDLFAAVGAHSGLPVGAARDNASAVIAMQRGNPGQRRSTAVPTIAFHGSADRVVHPRNGRLIAIRAVEPYAALRRTETAGQVAQGRAYVKTVHRIGKGRPCVEHWSVTASGHAWSGGSSRGRFTDPAGPDASREMVRFFLRHRLSARRAGPAAPGG
ncbi:extracellular catalytic domain type 1 short-chain-length polyhydroxyalkanoate depolymerase [Paracoccus spongiarum]|uniref:PHB depolymerase family esterase n=1 Tax=Paracoccus spongiarum TaxID=3064387 RepID=A0ABT9JA99_9RHOB|nr:PHB depolymerase family esterase [Paracoccus sp. 2205BS29-5]MDP5306650.1 PHB depolymerase family esterase [Paracoccus sp. 2205BS29-5]